MIRYIMHLALGNPCRVVYTQTSWFYTLPAFSPAHIFSAFLLTENSVEHDFDGPEPFNNSMHHIHRWENPWAIDTECPGSPVQLP